MKTSIVAEFYDEIELRNAIRDFRRMADEESDDEVRREYIEWAECYERELASRL